MISIFPHHNETFVAADSKENVILRVHKEVESAAKGPFGAHLTGWVRSNHFELLIRWRRQHPFMPVAHGYVEATSKGSIIFLEYSIPPSTRLLLLFWTVVDPVVAAIISLQSNNFLILGGGVAILLAVYGIAWINFRIHLKSTRTLLHQVILN